MSEKKNEIVYDDYAKLDIRAGRVITASEPVWSEKLIRYEVDLGEEIGNRVLFSGIRKWIKCEDLVGKMIPVVVNMAPKKMGEEVSQGMAMMVDSNNGPMMIYLPESVEPGAVIR